MWKIILYEFIYHKNILLLLFIIIPAIFLLQKLNMSGSYNILITFLLFFMLSKMLNAVRQEKRNRQILLFPVSIIHIALSRIMQVIIPCLIVYVEILLLSYLLRVFIVSYYLEIMYSLGFILLIFGLDFISYDILVNYSKKMIIIIKSLFIGLPILALLIGLILLFLFKNSNEIDRSLSDFVYAIQEHNPFSGFRGAFRFLCLNLCLLFFSLLTFKYKKSYLE